MSNLTKFAEVELEAFVRASKGNKLDEEMAEAMRRDVLALIRLFASQSEGHFVRVQAIAVGLGVSRSTAYRLATELCVVRVRRSLRVPVRAIASRFGAEAARACLAASRR